MASVSLKEAAMITVVGVMMMMMMTETTSADKPPHIIFIVADDMGWNDVEWRNRSMRTPNLNRLMENGILLNNSYMQNLCSPSRSAIMTGMYPYHTGLQHHVILWRQAVGIPEHLTILPEALKKRGYATHAVGKWHLGFCKWEYTPTERGFDSFLGFYGAMETFFTHSHRGVYDFRMNRDVLRNSEYSTDVFADRAIRVLNEHDKSKPLFLYLAFQAVHTPLEVPAKYEQKCSHISNRYRRKYCGMAASMDEAVGRITDTLEKQGYMDNLLLVFTSDNGGGTTRQGASNLPLRGLKSTLWEGGNRVPTFLYSKNLFTTSKRVHDGLVHAVDWLPTLMTVAQARNGTPSGIDGVSQWESIAHGRESPRNEFVYNIDRMNRNAAIRVGDYKLIKGDPDKRHGRPSAAGAPGPNDYMLYNLAADPSERVDIKDDNPQLLAKMKTRLDSLKASEVPPNFPRNDPAADPLRFGRVWSPWQC